MSCENGIAKSIISNCSTSKTSGIEATVYLFNRTDIASVTYSTGSTMLITGLTITTGTTGYELVGMKKSLVATSERVVAEDSADVFKHGITFKGFESDSLSVENMDNLGDVVAIVEFRDKVVEDGIFKVFGLGSGLFVETDTTNSNEANGARAIALASMAGWEERTSPINLLKTNYATTKSLLEGLV